MFIVAADHTARRAMVGLGDDPLAMADRRTMIDRLLTALDTRGVDGVFASADIMDDLALLGALHDKIAVGTMNRGGSAGAGGRWMIASRRIHTPHLARRRPRRGQDAAAHRLRRCGRRLTTLGRRGKAVQQLNDVRLMAMVEPIPTPKERNGKAVWDTDPLTLVRPSACVPRSELVSAYTWLKIRATADIAPVAEVTTSRCCCSAARRVLPEATFALVGAGAA